MIFRDTDEILGSGINPEISPDTFVAERQTSAMKYFAPTSSVSNILHKSNSIKIGANVIEDRNGRRGFTSELRAKPVVSSIRKLPKIDSNTDAAVTPMRVDKEEEPRNHKHRKSSRNVSESQEKSIEKSSKVEPLNTITTESLAEETPRKKKKSSRNVSESVAPEPVKVENPVQEPEKTETPSEEIPHKKKKSSRNVSESVAPEPVKVETAAEEAPRRKKKSSRNVSESVAPEPVKVEEPAEEAPHRKKKSSRNISDSKEKSEFEQVNKG
jgi:Pin2-interacting protein X1